MKKLSKKRSLSRKPKITELILYDDLVINEAEKTIEGQIGISKDNQIFREAPEKCSACNSTSIIALQVLGATDKELLWICDRCEKLFLKYTYRFTVRSLKKSQKYWTNPGDWVEPKENGEWN